MHLAFASDDAGVKGLAVAVLTAVETTAMPVHIWIVEQGVKAETQAALRHAWSRLRNLEGVNFIAQASLPFEMPSWWARKHWPLLSAARFQLPELLPADVSRCIYLDIDIIVGTDLGKLLDTDLQGCPVGMVTNSGMTPAVRDYVRTLDLDPDTYCNAGVMLIDLHAWRRELAAKRLIEHGRAMRPDIWFFDQDMLNTFFKGRCKLLDGMWNLRDAAVEPQGVVQHFAGSPKPWQTHPTQATNVGLKRWHEALARSGFAARIPSLKFRLGKWLAIRSAQITRRLMRVMRHRRP